MLTLDYVTNYTFKTVPLEIPKQSSMCWYKALLLIVDVKLNWRATRKAHMCRKVEDGTDSRRLRWILSPYLIATQIDVIANITKETILILQLVKHLLNSAYIIVPPNPPKIAACNLSLSFISTWIVSIVGWISNWKTITPYAVKILFQRGSLLTTASFDSVSVVVLKIIQPQSKRNTLPTKHTDKEQSNL